MTTLPEIEEAVSKLTAEEKGELLLRISAQLRMEGKLPEPREIPMEEMQAWIEEDEREGLRLRKEYGI